MSGVPPLEAPMVTSFGVCRHTLPQAVIPRCVAATAVAPFFMATIAPWVTAELSAVVRRSVGCLSNGDSSTAASAEELKAIDDAVTGVAVSAQRLEKEVAKAGRAPIPQLMQPAAASSFVQAAKTTRVAGGRLSYARFTSDGEAEAVEAFLESCMVTGHVTDEIDPGTEAEPWHPGGPEAKKRPRSTDGNRRGSSDRDSDSDGGDSDDEPQGQTFDLMHHDKYLYVPVPNSPDAVVCFSHVRLDTRHDRSGQRVNLTGEVVVKGGLLADGSVMPLLQFDAHGYPQSEGPESFDIERAVPVLLDAKAALIAALGAGHCLCRALTDAGARAFAAALLTSVDDDDITVAVHSAPAKCFGLPKTALGPVGAKPPKRAPKGQASKGTKSGSKPKSKKIIRGKSKPLTIFSDRCCVVTPPTPPTPLGITIAASLAGDVRMLQRDVVGGPATVAAVIKAWNAQTLPLYDFFGRRVRSALLPVPAAARPEYTDLVRSVLGPAAVPVVAVAVSAMEPDRFKRKFTGGGAAFVLRPSSTGSAASVQDVPMNSLWGDMAGEESRAAEMDGWYDRMMDSDQSEDDDAPSDLEQRFAALRAMPWCVVVHLGLGWDTYCDGSDSYSINISAGGPPTEHVARLEWGRDARFYCWAKLFSVATNPFGPDESGEATIDPLLEGLGEGHPVSDALRSGAIEAPISALLALGAALLLPKQVESIVSCAEGQ